jgi:PTS system fructose-specific IIC component
MNIVAVTACPTGIAHTHLAAEALKKTAEVMGHRIRVETQGSIGARDALSEAEIAAADVVVVAADVHVDHSRFAGKPVHEAHISDAIRNTRAVLQSALALAPNRASTSSPPIVDSAPNRASTPAPSVAASTPIVAAPRDHGRPASPATAASPNDPHPPTSPASAPAAAPAGGKRIVGITACPTGIAHTFMAAEALQKAAGRWGTPSRWRRRAPWARRTS